jgi:drug/metabolite transporter (DMT)-like permease
VTGLREPTVSLPRRGAGRGLLLVLMPVLWGATFPAAKLALEDLSVLALMAWTRALGLITLLVLLPWMLRSQDVHGRNYRALLAPGLGLGALLFAGHTLQILGLRFTTATNAGFITGLYVVLTPLLGAVLFREVAGRAVWVAVTLSVEGWACSRPLRSRVSRRTRATCSCCSGRPPGQAMSWPSAGSRLATPHCRWR